MNTEKKSLVGIVIVCSLVAVGALIAALAGSVAVVRATEEATPTGTIMYARPGGMTIGLCDSWPNACELRYALSSSVAGQEIWVAQGVYKPTTSTSDRSAAFQLKSGVAIYGGFVMTETLRTQRDPKAHVTVLSGDLASDDRTTAQGVVTITASISGTNSYHVVTGVTGATLDGMIITAGQANGSGVCSLVCGGGLLNNSSSPTLTDITFSGNSAGIGGGMYNDSSSNPVLTYVTFSGNSATHGGGGMYNDYPRNPTLTNVTFSGNSASDYGGGMFNSSSNPALTNVTFSGNSAAPGGGGMFNYASSPTLTNVTFSDNSASIGGGMENYAYSSPTLTNVTFSDNSAIQNGGGMYNDYYSSPTLSNVTFSDNSASNGGGGMVNIGGSATIRNSIFWSDLGGEIFNLSSRVVISNSVVQGGFDGTNIITADPLLGTLGNYGGSTQTRPLLPGSSALHATSADCPTTDQRGVARGSTCDIGAYEARGFTLTYGSGSGQATPITSVFSNPLVVSITSAYTEPVNGGMITFVGPLAGSSTNPITTTAVITNGSASRSINANGHAGTYTVTASAIGVSGTASFALMNLKGTTTISVTSAPNPSTVWQAVTFTATVTSDVGTPTGSITFTIDLASFNVPLGANGQAIYLTSTLTVGTHAVLVQYTGDSNFNSASLPDWITITVKPYRAMLPLIRK